MCEHNLGSFKSRWKLSILHYALERHPSSIVMYLALQTADIGVCASCGVKKPEFQGGGCSVTLGRWHVLQQINIQHLSSRGQTWALVSAKGRRCHSTTSKTSAPAAPVLSSGDCSAWSLKPNRPTTHSGDWETAVGTSCQKGQHAPKLIQIHASKAHLPALRVWLI